MACVAPSLAVVSCRVHEQNWLHCFRPPVDCDQTGLTLPVAEYNHSAGDCSITGGFVYRGMDFPGQGIYLCGDYCTGRVWGLQFDGAEWQTALLLDRDPGRSISTFGIDDNGNLLVGNYARGEVVLVMQIRCSPHRQPALGFPSILVG